MNNSFSRFSRSGAVFARVAAAPALAAAAIAAGWLGFANAEHAGVAALAATAGLAWLRAGQATKSRAALKAIEAACRRIAKGDFEARVTGIDPEGATADAEYAVNDAIDRCDAFVRESTASLEGVVRGVYYRLILLEGLSGAFRVAAQSINVSVKNHEKAVQEARREAEAEKNHVVQTIANGLARLAAKDLTARIGDELPDAYAQLRHDFNSALSEMETAIDRVRESADAIATGASQISAASDDLARRTERQAANLEESTASMRDLNNVVSDTANASLKTQDNIAAAKTDAIDSAAVVDKTIAAVTSITDSSQRIGATVGVIDEIAFQTNLLALNAGVEAARAGEAGRGFAVVATEVRALAQRSATAAKEIKAMIADSAAAIQQGVELMAATSTAFNRIKDQIAMIDGGISDIAGQALNQTSTLREVNIAMADIDQLTQQNAAMAEEANSACQSLAAESGKLAQMVAEFTVTGALPAAIFDAAQRLEPERENGVASQPSARAANAADDIRAPGAARNTWVQGDFLFESVICDLHLMALSVGGFAMLLTARAASEGRWTLMSWRSVLVDDSQPMQLTLRFHADIGLPAETSSRIARFYASLGGAKGASSDIERLLGPDSALDKPALIRAAERWRRLCGEAVGALQAAAPESKRRLPGPYEEDARALLAFLEEAGKGDTRRVDRFGVIALPPLKQRRRSPRAAVRHGCVLVLPAGRARAEIEDVSRGGLGLICRETLREGQEVVIELNGGRRLVGAVARRNGDHTGVRLAAPLAENDPLFARG